MSFLDPVLGWSLLLPPFLGIFVMSFIITMIINLIYKFTTDQKEMKRLKEEIDSFRGQMKAAKDNPKKMMKLNEQAMSVNMQYMGKSLKPTLYTFIPIIFIFAWMNAHFTYAPLAAGEPLTVQAQFLDGFTGNATLTSKTLTTTNVDSQLTVVNGKTVANFAIAGAAGKHDFVVTYEQFSYNGSAWFGQNPEQQAFPGKGPVATVAVQYPKVHPLGPVSLFGWTPGWLAIYITLSIILSITTRKLLKIY